MFLLVFSLCSKEVSLHLKQSLLACCDSNVLICSCEEWTVPLMTDFTDVFASVRMGLLSCLRMARSCHPRAEVSTRSQFFTANLVGLRPASRHDFQMDDMVLSYIPWKAQFLNPIITVNLHKWMGMIQAYKLPVNTFYLLMVFSLDPQLGSDILF